MFSPREEWTPSHFRIKDWFPLLKTLDAGQVLSLLHFFLSPAFRMNTASQGITHFFQDFGLLTAFRPPESIAFFEPLHFLTRCL